MLWRGRAGMDDGAAVEGEEAIGERQHTRSSLPVDEDLLDERLVDVIRFSRDEMQRADAAGAGDLIGCAAVCRVGRIGRALGEHRDGLGFRAVHHLSTP